MKYDYAIIGAGPGGYTFAIRASQYGKKCIVFDKNYIGGTCLNVGCIPSKVWIHIANLFDSIKNKSEKFGITITDAQVKWEKVQQYRREVISKLQNGIKTLFKFHKIEFKGCAVSKIDGSKVFYTEDADEKSVEAEKIILAIGGVPMQLKEIDYTAENVYTYKNCFDIEDLPSTILIVGGGIIGIELGCVFAKFGVKVYILEILDSILTGIDKVAVEYVAKNLKRLGVEILVGCKVEDIRYSHQKIEVVVKNLKSQQITKIYVNKLISAVGIKPPDFKNLIDCQVTEKGWIKVDGSFRTSKENVYAIGDIIGPPFLAHKASFQARYLADSLEKGETHSHLGCIPSVVYSDPEIAFAGLQEEEAQQKKIEYKVCKYYYSALGKAISDGHTDGFVKVITTPNKKEVLGVTIVGYNASELISEFVLAIENKISLEDIARVVHPHPTYSEIVFESIEHSLGFAIHCLPQPIGKK
jgi:dihydrolipoamide dehydrogenase